MNGTAYLLSGRMNAAMPHHVQTPGVEKTKIVEQIRAREMQGMLLCSPEHVYYTSRLLTIQSLRKDWLPSGSNKT